MKYILLIPLIKALYFLLLLTQQNSYKITSLFSYLKRYFFKTHFIFITYLSIFFLLNNKIINIIIFLVILLISLMPSRYIIKLKFTKRLLRLLFLNILIIAPLVIFFNETFFYLTFLYLLFFIVTLSNIILFPIEVLIIKKYKKKCIKKLSKTSPYIIEITGSYGKTTLKNILYDLYESKYVTLKTPASYNTPMGISKTILKELTPLTELFIVEAGATKQGDIKEITKMIKPNLGIITQIGPQHLKTFKTMDNVLKTKWELVTNMEYQSKVILNEKSKYLEGLVAYNLSQTITANNTSSDYEYKNVVINDLITEFDIYSKGDFLLHIKTKMLGLHNIQNIVLAYAVKKVLDNEGFYLSDEEFKMCIFNLTNYPHRLSIKEEQINKVTFRYLDDAYNSNLEGFIEAVNTLKSLKGIKSLITPGIVDTGTYQNIINETLVMHLNNLDDLILIDNQNIINLTKHLKSKHIPYLIFSSLKEAISFLKEKYQSFQDTYINILLENDLPDNYLKR